MVVRSRDGKGEFRSFQPCAVRIAVERSAVGNRERLVMTIADMAELTAAERAK